MERGIQKQFETKKSSNLIWYLLAGAGVGFVGWKLYSKSEYKKLRDLTDERMVEIYKMKSKHMYPSLLRLNAYAKEALLLSQLIRRPIPFQTYQERHTFITKFKKECSFFKTYIIELNQFLQDYDCSSILFFKKHNQILDELEKNMALLNPADLDGVYKLATDEYQFMWTTFSGMVVTGQFNPPLPEELGNDFTLNLYLKVMKEAYDEFPAFIKRLRDDRINPGTQKIQELDQFFIRKMCLLECVDPLLQKLGKTLEELDHHPLYFGMKAFAVHASEDQVFDYSQFQKKLVMLKSIGLTRNDESYQSILEAYEKKSIFKCFYQEEKKEEERLLLLKKEQKPIEESTNEVETNKVEVIKENSPKELKETEEIQENIPKENDEIKIIQDQPIETTANTEEESHPSNPL